MSDERKDIRFKFNSEERTQLETDARLIHQTMGAVPYKYLFLSAVHQWANRIRAGKEIDR